VFVFLLAGCNNGQESLALDYQRGRVMRTDDELKRIERRAWWLGALVFSVLFVVVLGGNTGLIPMMVLCAVSFGAVPAYVRHRANKKRARQQVEAWHAQNPGHEEHLRNWRY